jgi:two-component system alkaline phosphatase synthesis response regulator PhoP
MTKILVCEKEEVLLTALEFRLRKQGYEVEQAADGVKALQVIEKERPDILVIGTESKKMSGLEVLRRVREQSGDALPVILIAPLEAEEEIMEGFRLGANDFVTKPFKPVELVLRVRRLFEV